MAMKETEGSLRAYFLVAGALALLLGIRDLGEASKVSVSSLPTDWLIAIYLPLIVRMLLGAGFVISGLGLKAALPTGAGWIKHILALAGMLQLGNVLLIAAILGTELGRDGLIAAVIGLAITVYLYRSVTRLSAEAIARVNAPPATHVV